MEIIPWTPLQSNPFGALHYLRCPIITHKFKLPIFKPRNSYKAVARNFQRGGLKYKCEKLQKSASQALIFLTNDEKCTYQGDTTQLKTSKLISASQANIFSQTL